MRQQLRWHLGAQTALWLVLCGLVLHLGHSLHLRVDATADGRHSLSDAARAVVERLDAPLVARVWFTEDLAPPYHAHREALLDLLAGLDDASGGQLQVTVRDPTGDPALQAEARADGVDPVPYSFRSADRAEARSVYLGVALLYRDEAVAIDALPSIPRMEIELVRAIDALTADRESQPVVGWWLGHGEPDPTQVPANSPIRELYTRLSERAVVRLLGTPDAPIPEDVDVLLVAGPRSIPPDDRVHLDQYVARGGRVALFVSSFAPDFARQTLTDVDHGLYGVLGAWGLRLGRDIVLDRQHSEKLPVPMRAPEGVRWVPVAHPLAPVTTALDRSVAVVRRLPRLVAPFAATLSVADPLPEGIEAEVWATTDADAAAIKGLRTLDPQVLRQTKLSSEVAGPHGLIVALSGRFPSAFAGQELPPRRSGAPWPPLVERARPARVVVVSSADALPNGLDLATNLVDWLAEDEMLIGLRSRQQGEPSLAAPSPTGLWQAKAAMVGAPLAVLVLVGLLSARRRS